MCGQYLLLPWIQLLKIDYRGKLVKNVKGLYQEKLKRLHQILFQLYENYTNLFAIELSIVSRLHRENILNTLITMTAYLPMS